MRIRTHTNPLNYRQRFKKLQDYGFANTLDGIDFEIGFGQEAFIINHAQQTQNRLIVGVEVKKKAVTLLQEKIDERQLTNLLALHGNGHMCLEDTFDDHTIDNIYIFHPDPWMKRRHYNRRVINEHLLALAYQKLKQTGKLYISTDVESLWEYIMGLIAASNNFTRIDDPIFWQEFYTTRWTDMCREKQRTIFYGTFSPK